ncbi:hypothetical protein JK229_21280 [Pantoea dispersa]|uniref:hypothetical protein n=1 Tax=Pantoea dispersa TaxID=59814 RepID=UPI001BAB35CB|nr:hypothetical protein [Pantoea dispersa]MBS0899805.1 hypothetical protein [Pantoea dispersa]MBS0907637.1 hypothetical protein [Pantoea dispersa]
MGRTYIKNYGIYSQYAKNSVGLHELVRDKVPASTTAPKKYTCGAIDVIRRDMIKREDRAVMNNISKMAVNALADLLNKMDISSLSQVMLYSACDSEEHSFDTFREIVQNDPDNFWRNISDFNKLSNPLDMLRLLPTNTLYHISKILQNHHEGVPLRTASLSGMSALKMAIRDVACGRNAAGALVFSSANMLSFDSLTVFGKFNEVRHDAQSHSGILPAWGSVCLHIDDLSDLALAELVVATIHYRPKIRFDKEDWLFLLAEQKNHHGTPDVIVSYDNGIAEQAIAEHDALHEIFPEVKTVNYKSLNGYTGKSNNLLDILCCLEDTEIKPGSRVLINGTGINYGLGCILLIKQDVKA